VLPVSKPRPWWIASLVAVLLLVVYGAISFWDRQAETTASGLLAPPFRARVLLPAFPATVAPEAWLTLEQYRGKIVLLNFWASWCTTCRTESGLLNRLHTEYDSETFAVVGLATQDDPQHVVTVGRALQHRYLMALDSDGSIARRFGVNSLPQTFLIDASGRIRYHLQGPIQDSQWPGLTRAIQQAQTRARRQRTEP
jgi:peroxiredoxin